MANENKSNRRGNKVNTVESAVSRATTATERANDILMGAPEPELSARSHLDSLVRNIARSVSETQRRLTGGNTLETMSRLTQDSLLQTPIDSSIPSNRKFRIGDKGATLKTALDNIDSSTISELFSTEKGRIEDYQTFAQIADLIPQAAEAISCITDNITSPDDFTKRDLTVFFEGQDDEAGTINNEVKRRTNQLIEKYMLEDRAEEAISKSLIKGDFFIAVLNLRQEIETLLNEDGSKKDSGEESSLLFESHHIPTPEDADVKLLLDIFNDEVKEQHAANGKKDDTLVEFTLENFRKDFSEMLNNSVRFNESTGNLVSNELEMRFKNFGSDLPSTKKRNLPGRNTPDGLQSLSESKIRGSILKMIPPENVIKIYQGDTLFGYFFIELTGPDIADFARRGTMDQTALVRAIDQNMSSRFFGGASNGITARGKDALISRIFVKALSKRMGNAEFLINNEEFANDTYAILSRARKEQRRLTFTYVAPDQMVHFTPDGSTGYGTSALSRIKFLAKLYIGAMTNAFMRNSIRRPERLVWYIDVGEDNDDSNSVQNFIRTIKQREVKFSSLRDITTTINQIGEFHDFYIPTYDGERPVEVETINMGAAAEVDSPYLEFLRKGVVSGTGVPAAFIGYSEEVAFAKSLTMENGRFLRRVVRFQKHYSRSVTKLFRALWRNEYYSLEGILGEKPVAQETSKKSESKRRGRAVVVLDKDSKKNDDHGINDENLIISRANFDQIDERQIFIRYPSPATLNMTNLADAINQATPVIEFIVDIVASSESDGIKSSLKRAVTKDKMPQIDWGRYEKFLETARKDPQRESAIEGNTANSSGNSSSNDSSQF